MFNSMMGVAQECRVFLRLDCTGVDYNQRTNGPVDAHLLGLVKHKTWKIYGKEMTLTINTHIPS